MPGRGLPVGELEPLEMPAAGGGLRPAAGLNRFAAAAVALALLAVPLNILATPVPFLHRSSAAGFTLLAIAALLAWRAWRDRRFAVRAAAVFCWLWAAHFAYGYFWLSRLPTPAPEFAQLHCPDFKLLDQHGDPRQLTAMLDDGPVLLVFHRGQRDVSSITQLRELARLAPELRAAGVQVLAVSPDPPPVQRVLAESNSLPFGLLSDPLCEAAAALGVQQAGAGTSRNTAVGPVKGAAPVPSVFLIAPDRTIRWRFASPRVQVRPGAAELRRAVAALGGPGSASGPGAGL